MNGKQRSEKAGNRKASRGPRQTLGRCRDRHWRYYGLWPSSHAPLAAMYAVSVSTTFAPQPSSQRNRYGLRSLSMFRSRASAQISSLTSLDSSADEYTVPPGWWAPPETRPYTLKQLTNRCISGGLRFGLEGVLAHGC